MVRPTLESPGPSGIRGAEPRCNKWRSRVSQLIVFIVSFLSPSTSHGLMFVRDLMSQCMSDWPLTVTCHTQTPFFGGYFFGQNHGLPNGNKGARGILTETVTRVVWDVGCVHPGFASYLARICCPKVRRVHPSKRPFWLRTSVPKKILDKGGDNNECAICQHCLQFSVGVMCPSLLFGFDFDYVSLLQEAQTIHSTQKILT